MSILYTFNKTPNIKQVELLAIDKGKILFLENAVYWLAPLYAQLFINNISNLNLYQLYAIQEDVEARAILPCRIWQENNIVINYINYLEFVDLVANTGKIINV